MNKFIGIPLFVKVSSMKEFVKPPPTPSAVLSIPNIFKINETFTPFPLA